jgi:hypothetical protein
MSPIVWIEIRPIKGLIGFSSKMQDANKLILDGVIFSRPS